MTVIQLITGAIGSVAFGLLFHMKTKYLPLATAGGFLSWLVFLFGKNLWGSVFLPALLAGFIADVYAEILARICKGTSTSFFVTSVIPLIPGSTLYYCMSSLTADFLTADQPHFQNSGQDKLPLRFLFFR